jgi:serine/threonine protein kinase
MLNQTVNGYTLHHLLGAGGMAEVWYAENRIGKKAAIKIIKKELALLPEIVTRFENEAKVMVTLNHPYIRQVYDYAMIEGRPCIVMEYLEGSDLATRIKNGQRFNDKQLKVWWNQLVEALSYTHQTNVVHRDIKPSNIFLTNDGAIKLLDYGIAKVKGSLSSTLTGTRMGTLLYMSPEQVKDSKHIDFRTDVYSLAVTFLHLLIGKAPYDTTVHSEWEIQSKIVLEPLDLTKISEEWRTRLVLHLEKEVMQRSNLTAFTLAEERSEKHTGRQAKSPIDETIIENNFGPKRIQDQKDNLENDFNINKIKECDTSNFLLISDTKRIAYVVLMALGATMITGVARFFLGLPPTELTYSYSYIQGSYDVWLYPLSYMLVQVIIWYGLTKVGKIRLSPYWLLIAFLSLLHSSLLFQSIQTLLQYADIRTFLDESWILNTFFVLNNILFSLLFYTIAKQHRGMAWFAYSLLPLLAFSFLFMHVIPVEKYYHGFLIEMILLTIKEAILNILIVMYFFKKEKKYDPTRV